MKWWLIGAALFGVAALSVWFAFQSPGFVAGLSALAAGMAAKAIVTKVTARMPADEEAEWRAEERAGRGDEYLRKRRGAPPKG